MRVARVRHHTLAWRVAAAVVARKRVACKLNLSNSTGLMAFLTHRTLALWESK